jgi:hypothetical protein
MFGKTEYGAMHWISDEGERSIQNDYSHRAKANNIYNLTN